MITWRTGAQVVEHWSIADDCQLLIEPGTRRKEQDKEWQIVWVSKYRFFGF